MKTLVALAAVAAVMVQAAPSAVPQPVTPSRLTIEQLIDIRHPSNPMWSPDGRRVAFQWDRAGVSDWYIVDVDGTAAPHVALHTEGTRGLPKWSADGSSLIA